MSDLEQLNREVAERVMGRDFCCGFQDGDWRAQFVQFDTEPCNAGGKSLLEAICRAALQVVKPTEKINAT